MKRRAVGLQAKGRSLGWVAGLTTVKKPLLSGPGGLFRSPGHLQEGEIPCSFRSDSMICCQSARSAIRSSRRPAGSARFHPSPGVLQPGVDGLDMRGRITVAPALTDSLMLRIPHQAQALGQQDITALKVGTKGVMSILSAVNCRPRCKSSHDAVAMDGRIQRALRLVQ